MTMSGNPSCRRGPNGTPCGRAAAGTPRQVGRPWSDGEPECYLCWLWLNHPERFPDGPPPEPLPPPAADPSRWPLAARALARLRRPGERGLGDTAHRLLGGDRLPRLYQRVFGRDCGCGERAARLNAAFPYPPETQALPPAPAPPPADDGWTRCLLYHLYPRAGTGRWQWNVAQVRKRLPLFNGRRVVGVATDDTTDTLETVVREFGEDAKGVEFFGVPNDPSRAEGPTFLPLLDRVKDFTGPRDATFWGHGKGCTYGPDVEPVYHRGVKVLWSAKGTRPRWADAMYRTLLDFWPVVRGQLERKPVTGSFRVTGPFPNGHPRAMWIYSGSFFWFRNADLFARDWRRLEDYHAACEGYPSLLFRYDEAACVFGEGALSMLSEEYWDTVLSPALERWEAGHMAERTRLAPAPALPATAPTKIAVTMPGRMGDALYALPATRELCRREGCKADFFTSAYCRPLTRLLEYQDCIDRVVVPPEYRPLHDGCGVQPWLMPVPAGEYRAVYHLGFRADPDRPLPEYCAALAGVTLPPNSVRYDRPPRGDRDPPPPAGPYVCVHLGRPRGNGGEWGDLLGEFMRHCPLPCVLVGGPGENVYPGKGLEAIDLTGLDMLDTLPWLAGCRAFVGPLGAMLVLANGFPCRKVVPLVPGTPNLHHLVQSPRNLYLTNPSVASLLKAVTEEQP